jgi:hypothetical protein
VQIELILTTSPLERVEGDIAVAGFFSDERPLRGGAARADWRLCGGLSRRIESGDLSGKSGEALLIACGRALWSPRLLLLGLGDRHVFDPLRVADETREALDRCRKLRCERVALAPLGIAADDVPRHAAALVAGIRDAWRDAERPMSLHLCVPRPEVSGVRRAFEDAARAAGAGELAVSVPDPAVDSP